MIITKKAIPRRTVLRGVGAALALPLLDGMVPALSALGKTAARPTNRLGVVYVPNGIQEAEWRPVTQGTGFEFTPTLKPLEPFRNRLLVISGLDNTGADARAGEFVGQHSRPAAAFLTGAHAKRTTGSSLELGISMDQVVAKTLGQQTQLASLELSLEGVDTVNGVSTCDTGYSCAYLNISWRSTTTPMPRETNPRVVFERLFGDVGSTNTTVRLARIRTQRSILDSVVQKVRDLQGGLGAGDRLKISEYLEAIRDVERRIQRAEEQADRELPVVDSPAGIPVSFEEHARLMYDLLLLSYQCDLTRVFSFMIGREQSGTTYPQIGVPDSHHPISHHQRDPIKMAKLAKINLYHVTLFGQFLEKLRSTPDGDGSLLDHVMILYGASLRESNAHTHDNLPLLVAGGGAGQLKSGRHLVYPKGTRLANLHLTLMDKLGVKEEHFGDSNGTLPELYTL
jgi:hypothetical protein